MLHLLFDQDFDKDVRRGLQRRLPDLDALTAYEAGLSAAPDPELLAWAAQEKRILVTHDRKTMPSHFADRMKAGEPCPGVFIFSRGWPINTLITELEMFVCCSEVAEWENRIVTPPL